MHTTLTTIATRTMTQLANRAALAVKLGHYGYLIENMPAVTRSKRAAIHAAIERAVAPLAVEALCEDCHGTGEMAYDEDRACSRHGHKTVAVIGECILCRGTGTDLHRPWDVARKRALRAGDRSFEDTLSALRERALEIDAIEYENE